MDSDFRPNQQPTGPISPPKDSLEPVAGDSLEAQQSGPNPEPAQLTGSNPKPPKSKWIVAAIVIMVLAVGGAGGFAYYNMNKDSSLDTTEDLSLSPDTGLVDSDEGRITSLDCGANTLFESETFGATFCYPSEWGSYSIDDVKLAPSDTGHRQAVVFGATENFRVAAASDDWATEVGRGGGCFDPSSQVPSADEINSLWHNQQYTEGSLSFAQRFIFTDTSEFVVRETVDDSYLSAVCTSGYKSIEGPRYRVVNTMFFRSLELPQIPQDHVDNPNVLFTESERSQLQLVLTTLQAL